MLCFTLFVLTRAAPEPSKRGCCAPGPDCDNPCQDGQQPAQDAPEQAPPMAGYMPAPDAQQQQFMPAPEQQQFMPAQDQQQFMPAPDQQQFMPAPDQQQFMPAPPEQQQNDQPEDKKQKQNDCCQPGPSCFNPCAAPPPPPSFFVPPPPPPPAPCCQPGPTCMNPCEMPPPMPDMGMAGCCDPSVMPMCANPCPPPHPPRTAYAPYPGEITMKLKQPWKSEYTDHSSAAYQILSGNLATAIKAALRREAYVNNIYFREGYVPGNPSTQPITVAHFMVDGGSDDASLLQQSVTPDEDKVTDNK
ncbi:hypothetical protein ACROYT_G006222 [Oculina patagonica]